MVIEHNNKTHRFLPSGPIVRGEYNLEIDRLVLTEPHLYENNYVRIVVPEGFECDGATVPRVLWTIFPRVGKYLRATVIHDWLYRQRDISRRVADAFFLEIMEIDSVPKLTGLCMYWAVRAFGWMYWKKVHPPRTNGGA